MEYNGGCINVDPSQSETLNYFITTSKGVVTGEIFTSKFTVNEDGSKFSCPFLRAGGKCIKGNTCIPSANSGVVSNFLQQQETSENNNKIDFYFGKGSEGSVAIMKGVLLNKVVSKLYKNRDIQSTFPPYRLN